jgi:glutamine amidotransferase
MQLLFNSSTEYGQSPGLGLINGEIDLLEVEFKVPHMGWNSLILDKPKDPVLNYIKDDDYVYFIHSYYAKTKDDYIVASTDYGVKVPAIVRNKNVIGMQFHPEKSGEVGLRLLQAIKELI